LLGATLLSATLIARDEAHTLPDCLRSIGPLVDEIVLVDTGSRDATADIARAFGARVFSFDWCDDFSAARNYAIEQARGDWLLYIDADERVRPIDRRALDTDLATADLLCATVLFRPRTGYTAYRERRLIRNDPHIRFHGAMHETFMGDIGRLISAGAGRIGDCGLAIDHVGYDGDQSHKFDRNMRLLRKQIQADPRRVYLRWHLGTLYRDVGDDAAAEATWREGVQLARQWPQPAAEVALCAVELAKQLVARGEDPAPLIAEMATFGREEPMLRWLQGKSLLARGQYDDAVPIFVQLAEIDPETLVADVSYDARLFGAHAWAELGDAAFRLGRYLDSRRCYECAERVAPLRAEFRVKRQLAASRTA
jgi:tetratricopeptide (TPR) repeat protein